MTHELRIKVAALATAGFLAAISIAGLGLRHGPQPTATATQAAPAQTQQQAKQQVTSNGDEEAEPEED